MNTKHLRLFQPQNRSPKFSSFKLKPCYPEVPQAFQVQNLDSTLSSFELKTDDSIKLTSTAVFAVFNLGV